MNRRLPWSAAGLSVVAVLSSLNAACESRGAPVDADLAAALDGALDAAFDGAGGADAAPPDLGGADMAGCPRRQVRAGGQCVPCSVLVPADQATVGAAIAAAPSPGAVCIAAGSYHENLTLRPHVSIYGGYGGGVTRVAGNLSLRGLSDADPTPTTIADLTIRFVAFAALTGCPADQPNCAGSNGIVNTGRTFALRVERVIFDGDEDTGTMYCAQLETYSGDMDVTVRDSTCRGDRGLRLRMDAAAGGRLRANFLIERNRFEPPPMLGWTYDSVELLMNPADSTPLAAGTQVTATVRNNEFLRSHIEAIYLVSALPLAAADQAAARVRIVNNSFVSQDGQGAIWDNSQSGRYPLHLSANNLFFGTAQPRKGRLPAVTAADQTTSTSPFVDLAGGDLHLRPGSAPVDAGDPAWAPADDRDGLPRPVAASGGAALPDVAAHELQAPRR